MTCKVGLKAKAQFSSRYSILTNAFQSAQDGKPQSAIAAAQRQFSNYFPQFLEVYETILLNESEFSDADIKVELDSTKTQFTKVSDMSVKLDELMLSPGESSAHIKSEQLNVQLSTIKLPQFSGNIVEWLSFRDLFLTLVNSRVSLSDSEKHYYLRTSVSGEALSVINHLPMDANNYQGAWQLLRARYDNSRSLTDTYLDRIFSLPSVTSTSDLRWDLYDPLRESVQALGQLSLPIIQWSYLLVFIVLKKLPFRLRQLYEERYGKAQEGLPTFDQLMELLDEQCCLQTAVSPAQSAHRASEPSRRPRVRSPRQRPMALNVLQSTGTVD